ncbi:DUF1642 domain-containing protein [Lacticaseibacillus paracasei]
MSEEKLYAVKNAEGKYWDFADRDRFKKLTFVTSPTTIIEEDAKDVVHNHGGHFVTLVEEPEKVVLSEKQAEIVEEARVSDIPATYISARTNNGEESLLMNAYVNGYTVEKEKKYNVKVPKKWSGDDKHYWTKEQDGALTWACLINKDYMIPTQQFTLTEIEHYGLQDCEKEEVTDDEQ